MSAGTEGMIANACLAWMCCVWPGLVGFACFNIGRYGLRGWVRRGLERAKAGLPGQLGEYVSDD